MPPSRAEVTAWVEARLGRALSAAEQADLARCTGAPSALVTAFAAHYAVDLAPYRAALHEPGRAAVLGWPLPARPPHGLCVPLSVTLLHRAAVEGRWPVTYPDLPPVPDLSWLNPVLVIPALVAATALILQIVARLA